MTERWGPRLVMALGLAQMLGALLGFTPLQGVAAATAASPAPRVFTTVDGYEAFSSRIFVEYEDARGEHVSIEITPERYSRVEGAYNRRNAYGAVVAAAPVLSRRELTRAMSEAVSRYALCGDAPLLREIGVAPAAIASPVTVRYEPRAKTPSDVPLTLTIDCAP